MPANAYARLAPAHRLAALLDEEPETGPHLRLVEELTEAPAPIDVPRTAEALRPATPHTGALATMDAQQRVSIVKALAGLDWTEDSDLVIELVAAGQAEVRPFDPDRQHPGSRPTRLDRGRVLLSAAARAGLELVPGAQVLAIALPEQQRVLLLNASAAMAQLTGLVAEPAAERVLAPAAAARTSGTGPRAAWAPRPA